MVGASGDSANVYLSTDKLGRTYIKGLHETRRALMAMGMERNQFEKWIKQSAIITAREAGRMAPIQSGRLASSIRAAASKKYTSHNQVKRAYGGVVLGRTPYARQTSYGMRHEAGQNSIAGDRTWRKTTRGRNNEFMVRARERSKPVIVRFWRTKIKQWTEQKGFETNGF